ncbi:MAG: DUF4159 domain-containing protein [Victivallales bacterium]|nr:DUF4159 domain-containing protein [Victivallales bacterium]
MFQIFRKFWRTALLVIVMAMPLTAQELRVAQFVSGATASLSRNYPTALPSLLAAAREATGLPFAAEPILLATFTDPRLRSCPFLYMNWDDRKDWANLPDAEAEALRQYLRGGGLAMVDAGISASFLRTVPGQSQHHSFAEWEAQPEVRDFFARVLPGTPFTPLRRDDPLFRNCFEGLPDATLLPETVRVYAQEEKWPSGTYSAVAIRLQGRLAVLCVPVIAMGWGRSVRGWETTIRFRALEGTTGLGEMLETAPYSGPRFEVTREDGGKDAVYCQGDALPAWAQDPAGAWRVFRYYDSRQISDFTHVFYTRLGINILVTALLGD